MRNYFILIIYLILACFGIILIPGTFFKNHLPAQISLKSQKIDKIPKIKETNAQNKREYIWKNSKKKLIETEFNISKKKLDQIWKKFGLARGMTHFGYVKKQGFMITKNILMINYPLIFKRNSENVKPFALSLCQTADIEKEEKILLEFLLFVQQMPYKLPPMYLKGKKIMEFFPPMICLNQGFGDCDSKAILLADLVAMISTKEPKFAVLILNIFGKPHMLLAIKKNPMIGMTAINIIGEGTFILIETSVPGYFPGFIGNRNEELLKDKNMIIQMLN